MTDNSQSQKFMIKDGIDIFPLLSAFSQFHEALQIAQSDLEKAGTIHYFKFTYELAWKTLKRILVSRGKVINSPKPVFKVAALEGLIDNPDHWFEFAEDRDETVHTYNKSVANSIFSDLSLFDAEMIKLIERIKALKVDGN